MSNSESEKTIRHRAPVPKTQCPMALAAEILGDRWTMLILRESFYGVQRFDDMRQDLGAPRAMLTDRLNKLVKQNILERHSYTEQGNRARNAYRLTSAGRALGKVLIAMSEWGEAFVTQTPAPAYITDSSTGKPLRLGFVDEDGSEVASKNAVLTVREANER